MIHLHRKSMVAYDAYYVGGSMAIVTLTTEREGEIALKVLKAVYQRKGINSLRPVENKRELGNLAKEIDIPLEELMFFARKMSFELLEEAFPK